MLHFAAANVTLDDVAQSLSQEQTVGVLITTRPTCGDISRRGRGKANSRRRMCRVYTIFEEFSPYQFSV